MNAVDEFTLAHAREIFPPIWVVYMRPDDFPTGYVVRCWWGMVPDPHGEKCATLAQAREYIATQGGCFLMGPQFGDPDSVLESWL